MAATLGGIVAGLVPRFIRRVSREHPGVISAATGFVTFGAGDIIIQATAKSFTPSKIDYKRSMEIGMLGLVMNGVLLRVWYSKLDQYVGSAMKDVKNVVIKCTLDQLLLAPISIASYFAYSRVIQYGVSWETIDELKYTCQCNFLSTWIADCYVWPLANIICYGFIQLQHRVPFICVVQLGWQTYMASVGKVRNTDKTLL